MQLWKMTLTYDGTPFHGWQIQPELPTVQGTLSSALKSITGEHVLPQGSGRTDTGVHALAQVASFALEVPIPAVNLHMALNRILPPSIRVTALEPAPEGFHARYSAVRKTYEYRIFPADPIPAGRKSIPRICSPMLASFVWACHWPLNVKALEEAAAQIVGTHDFTSFSAVDPDLSLRELGTPKAEAANVRTIFASCWHQTDGILIYRVTGSGFLHHMVRNLVGTFVDAGAGRISPDAIDDILAARNRSAAGPTAPAKGLFLAEVAY
jgi:tRNA pseudouridine38-40 synthase